MFKTSAVLPHITHYSANLTAPRRRATISEIAVYQTTSTPKASQTFRACALGKARTHRWHDRDRRRVAQRSRVLRNAFVRRTSTTRPSPAITIVTASGAPDPPLVSCAAAAAASPPAVPRTRVRLQQLRLVWSRRHLLGLETEDLVLTLETVVLLAQGVALGDESAVLVQLGALLFVLWGVLFLFALHSEVLGRGVGRAGIGGKTTPLLCCRWL